MKKEKEINVQNTDENVNDMHNVKENPLSVVDDKKDEKMIIASLEQKILSVEEKIDSVIGYLEEKNNDKLNDELNKAVNDSYSIARGDGESLSSDDFTQEAYHHIRKKVVDELAPLIDYAKKCKSKEDRDMVINIMRQNAQMADAYERADELDEIIEKYPALKNSSDIMEKYVTAYVISKGSDKKIFDAKNLTVEELIDLLDENDELKKALWLKMKDELKPKTDIPPASYSGGITTFNIEEKPKNMHDAKKATFKLFK